MKMNAPRRQIVRDAVDLIPHPDVLSPTSEVQIPISQIRPYHNHMFHLYEGERLDDMVESIRANGVLNPVIVHALDDGSYEMLAGHNRMNASKLAGLTAIPAIIKTGLTEDEAWLYVMETNLHQRSFDDLAPSEQAAILFLQYDKMSNQGKRNDIARELAILDGTMTAENIESTKPKNSRKELAERYSLSSTTVARLLRVNRLITEFKLQLDSGKLPLLAAVEISYLSEDEQMWLHEFISAYTYKLDKNAIAMLRQKSQSGGMTKESQWAFLIALDKKKHESVQYQTMKLPKGLYQKYFTDTPVKEAEEIMVKALELYYRSLKTAIETASEN